MFLIRFCQIILIFSLNFHSFVKSAFDWVFHSFFWQNSHIIPNKIMFCSDFPGLFSVGCMYPLYQVPILALFWVNVDSQIVLISVFWLVFGNSEHFCIINMNYWRFCLQYCSRLYSFILIFSFLNSFYSETC